MDKTIDNREIRDEVGRLHEENVHPRDDDENVGFSHDVVVDGRGGGDVVADVAADVEEAPTCPKDCGVDDDDETRSGSLR